MQKSFAIAIAMIAMIAVVPAMAELQNIEVGGSLRIRWNSYSGEGIGDNPRGNNSLIDSPFFRSGGANAGVRWTAGQLFGRAVGSRPVAPGTFPSNGASTGAIAGIFSWDADNSHDLTFVEERATISVKADFTNDVSAFIEIDNYEIWGTDFRSNYVTGADFADPTATDDFELYQGYIEANNMFGYPVRLRIGRQEMSLGSEWLVGTNSTAAGFWGLSFDAIRLTYATDMVSVDAFWAKLVETGAVEANGDVDMYGIYGSYLGLEDIVIDAYWLRPRRS